MAQLRIPMNSDTHSDPYRTVIPIQFGHFSERSDAVFGLLEGKAGRVKVGRGTFWDSDPSLKARTP